MKILTTRVLLRTASVVALLYCAGHMSGYPWTPGEGAAASAVVEQMRAISFAEAGPVRTYWDFYLGFGHIISAFLATNAVLLGWLSTWGDAERRPFGALLGTLLASELVNAYLSYRYFFALPSILALLIAASIAGALVLGRVRGVVPSQSSSANA